MPQDSPPLDANDDRLSIVSNAHQIINTQDAAGYPIQEILSSQKVYILRTSRNLYVCYDPNRKPHRHIVHTKAVQWMIFGFQCIFSGSKFISSAGQIKVAIEVAASILETEFGAPTAMLQQIVPGLVFASMLADVGMNAGTRLTRMNQLISDSADWLVPAMHAKWKQCVLQWAHWWEPQLTEREIPFLRRSVNQAGVGEEAAAPVLSRSLQLFFNSSVFVSNFMAALATFLGSNTLIQLVIRSPAALTTFNVIASVANWIANQVYRTPKGRENLMILVNHENIPFRQFSSRRIAKFILMILATLGFGMQGYFSGMVSSERLFKTYHLSVSKSWLELLAGLSTPFSLAMYFFSQIIPTVFVKPRQPKGINLAECPNVLLHNPVVPAYFQTSRQELEHALAPLVHPVQLTSLRCMYDSVARRLSSRNVLLPICGLELVATACAVFSGCLLFWNDRGWWDGDSGTRTALLIVTTVLLVANLIAFGRYNLVPLLQEPERNAMVELSLKATEHIRDDWEKIKFLYMRMHNIPYSVRRTDSVFSRSSLEIESEPVSRHSRQPRTPSTYNLFDQTHFYALRASYPQYSSTPSSYTPPPCLRASYSAPEQQDDTRTQVYNAYY
ncbi:MAG: hypothetical protein A3J38_03245 [Gammaproteobacteria bacterium RIFCSPHIGHO2_12_FULL_45_9]|nr:MAG: hypothetical protein A3J38_03245 [Gammaproteobacteria bacterium RIFCSPHIGHO2_12_FULL_45_9]